MPAGAKPVADQSRHRKVSREGWIIVAYFVVTLLLAATLAPPLYWGSRAVVEIIRDAQATGWPVLGYVSHHLAKADLTRVFNRACLVSALVCLWPAVRLLRVRRADLGLKPNPHRWRHLAFGFFTGAGFLLAMAACYLAVDLFAWRKTIAWSAVVRDSLIRAAGAGIVEELLFRGALLGLMLRASSPRAALLGVTTLFAAVHFLQTPNDVPPIHRGVEWSTGFWLLGQILRTFTGANFLIAEFATLWLAGYLLGWMRLRTRSLWLPIGLHSGWVFAIGAIRRPCKGVEGRLPRRTSAMDRRHPQNRDGAVAGVGTARWDPRLDDPKGRLPPAEARHS